MVDCKFYRVDDATARCERCERDVAAPVRAVSNVRLLKRRCTVDAPPIEPPPPLRRLVNFTRAAIAHYLAGSPTCTQHQIDVRMMVCKTCPLFIKDPKRPGVGVCGHSDCGCTLTRDERFLSKLGWADQGCPLGKWLTTLGRSIS